jgi:predicted small metal-binding protein
MVAKHARRIHQMENISEDDLVLLLPEDVTDAE